MNVTTLIEKIRQDQLRSRLEKDVISSALLTTLLSEAEAVGKKNNRKPYDEEVVAVVRKFLKNNEEFTRVNTNHERGEVLTKEKALLETYLPKQLTENELKGIISDLKPADMKAIMWYLKANYAGRYDGKQASELVKTMCL
jgi:uncharacterized protein YqeY